MIKWHCFYFPLYEQRVWKLPCYDVLFLTSSMLRRVVTSLCDVALWPCCVMSLCDVGWQCENLNDADHTTAVIVDHVVDLVQLSHEPPVQDFIRYVVGRQWLSRDSLLVWVEGATLKVYYDLDWPSLKVFHSSHLLGCYCHPDYLVRFVRQANLSKHSDAEKCKHFLTSKHSLTQVGMHYKSNQVAYVCKMTIASQ